MLSIEGRTEGAGRLYRIEATEDDAQSLMLGLLGFVESNSRNEILIKTGWSSEVFYSLIGALGRTSGAGAEGVRLEVDSEGARDGWMKKPRPAIVVDLDMETFEALVDSFCECLAENPEDKVFAHAGFDPVRMKNLLLGFLAVVALGDICADVNDEVCGIFLMDSSRGVRAVLSHASVGILNYCALKCINKFPHDSRGYIEENLRPF
ncbi:hypothetical protein ACWFMI_25530 [Nocardiopsis terrae]